MIVVVLNGWGPLLRGPGLGETRTATMVREVVAGYGPHVLMGRSWWASPKVRQVRAFLAAHNHQWETCLLVGKGQGAVALVRALNTGPRLAHCRVGLVTINPLCSQRNHRLLSLTRRVHRVTNYFGFDPDGGGGAVLRAPCSHHLDNIPFAGEDLHSIVERAEVRVGLERMARWVYWGRG